MKPLVVCAILVLPIIVGCDVRAPATSPPAASTPVAVAPAPPASPATAVAPAKAALPAVPNKPAPSPRSLGIVPHKDDETTLLQLKADPSRYTESDLIICGGITIGDYYNYAYEREQPHFYSLVFKEVGQTADDLNKQACTLYLSKINGSKVIDEIVRQSKALKYDSQLLLVRARVTLRQHKYVQFRKWDMLEVLDVQFCNDNWTEWQPWMFEKDRQEKIKRERTAAELEAEYQKKFRAKLEADQKNIDLVTEHNATVEAKEKTNLEKATWRDVEDPKGGTANIKYGGITAGNVRLVRRDGTSFRLPLDELPEDIQAWIKEKPWTKATKQKK